MGWAGGSDLMDRIIRITQDHVPDPKTRKRMYQGFIEAFEESDWDTQDESMGKDPAFDEAVTQLHPDWFEEGER
jgi:hypothetical protein